MKEVNEMKLKEITEVVYPFRTRYTIVYSGCKASNNGLRTYVRETLTRKELEFVLNTKPTRSTTYTGATKYTYIAE